MALILERKASKDEILELYLNEVYLGQRGSFAVHGVAEAARLFFGKDVTNLSLGEAATIAGVIQSPYYWSPFAAPARCRERRNIVLGAMAEEEFISAEAAARAGSRAHRGRAARARRPGAVLRRRRRAVAGRAVPGALAERQSRRGVHDARPPPAAPGAGRAARGAGAGRRDARQAQAARARAGGAHRRRPAHRRGAGAGRRPLLQPVAVQPRRRRPASARLGLQAVRVPGGVRDGGAEDRTDLTPATLVTDEPTTFLAGGGSAAPDTLPPAPCRRPRNTATNSGRLDAEQLRERIRRRHHAAARAGAVAQHRHHQGRAAGRLQQGRRALGSAWASGTDARGYPSITLGVFEASPYEIATAYTIFPNGGVLRPLRVLSRVVADGRVHGRARSADQDALRAPTRRFSSPT